MLKQFFFCYKICFQNQFITFLLFFCLFFQCAWKSSAELDVNGSFRVRGVLSQIQNEKAPLFLTHGRLHIDGEFHLSNKFKTQAHLLFSNSYEKTFSFEESIRIYPFVSWLINEDLELRLGRTTYENKFHQIVSVNDYEPFFYTFDGAFLEYSTNILNINFWGAYLPKKWVENAQNQDLKYGFGFFLYIKSVSDYIDYFNAHIAYLGSSFLKKEAQKMSRYGFGLEGAINSINLTYSLIFVGHDRGVQFKQENMYHFQLSYSHIEFFDSKIFAGYHKDSSKYNPWLYDRHENAGFLDLFLWGNLSYYFLGFSASVNPLFDIKISFYDFNPTRKGTIHLGYFGSLLKGKNKNLVNMDNQDLGREIDIKLQRQIKENFEIHLLAGLFIPRSETKKLFKVKDFYKNVQLTGLYKF